MVAPARLRPHTRDNPCLVCGGHRGLPRGLGVRCVGFTLDYVCYCTREEFAGRAELDITTQPPAFKHLLVGRCSCGQEHGFATRPTEQAKDVERAIGLPLEVRHEIS